MMNLRQPVSFFQIIAPVYPGAELTKIELELEEAPENKEQHDHRLPSILVGSMPTELDSTAEINSTYPHAGFPGSPGAVVVRAEEALIVVFVLVLWVAAIALFFNRWGKIRMLEPYQPKFQQQQHRTSCAVAETTTLPLRTCSKFNIQCLEHPLHPSGQSQRLRQNSVFVGSSVSLLPNDQSNPRRTKSAFDLQSLVLAECTIQSNARNNNACIHDQTDADDTIESEAEYLPLTIAHSASNRRLKPFNEYPKLSRSFQRERGASVCHFDRTDVLARPLQRERGMSICHFDRMDVLARPLQPRDRGSSICHFDRMDVLARPIHYRGSRASIASNVDKLENLGRSLQRDSRASIMFNTSTEKTQIGALENFQRFAASNRSRETRANNISSMDRPENLSRYLQRDSRASLGNNERAFNSIDTIGKNLTVGQSAGNVGIANKDKSVNSCPYDRPSCSKTPDVVLGYEATCV